MLESEDRWERRWIVGLLAWESGFAAQGYPSGQRILHDQHP